jgi:hypothetical protein
MLAVYQRDDIIGMVCRHSSADVVGCEVIFIIRRADEQSLLRRSFNYDLEIREVEMVRSLHLDDHGSELYSVPTGKVRSIRYSSSSILEVEEST